MNRYNRSGLITLISLSAFVAYRNRHRIREFLESKGIKTPLDASGRLSETVRAGVAKISGQAERKAG